MDLAKAGEMPAIRELFDRLFGKSVATVDDFHVPLTIDDEPDDAALRRQRYMRIAERLGLKLTDEDFIREAENEI